ncbi:hypothetical protein HZA97_08880 [Candidatus Woesearchaeota archaeon]|nr:hypothetical protein [Candidatus Woesearchaeota archaeon]
MYKLCLFWSNLMGEYTLTKKLSKHGKQCILVIPSYLTNVLKPSSVVEVKIKTLEVGE